MMLAAWVAWGVGGIWLIHVRTPPNTFKVDRYFCELCGFEFWVRRDRPPPTANVRPDLIEKGYQRLKEKEEEEDELML